MKYKNDQGTMSLEAAIIIPFFLAFVFGLLILIRIAFVEIALQHAADETVKQLAGVLSPMEAQIQQVASLDELGMNAMLQLVPDSLKDIVEPLMNQQSEKPFYQAQMNEMFKPVYWHFVDKPYKDILSYERLSIDYVAIPYINNHESMLGIEASYAFNVWLPFYQTTIDIRKRAYERVWFGM